MPGDIFVAKGGAVVVTGDRRIVLQQGQTVREGHPLLKGREQLFEPFTVDFEVDDAPAPVEEPPQTPPAAPLDAKAVRAWAAEQGIDVSPKGKLPAEVEQAYRAAHSEA